MRHTLLLISLCCAAAAFPGVQEASIQARDELPLSPRDDHATFQAPRPDEKRSPYAGLNAAANHNICPRSGKGYTIEILTKCLREAFNMEAPFAVALGAAGLASNPNTQAKEFDLDMLKTYGPETDKGASSTRGKTFWTGVLKDVQGEEPVTRPVVAKAMNMSAEAEKLSNPKVVPAPMQVLLRYAETAIYLVALGEVKIGTTKTEYLKVLFEEERLPYKEGWKTPSQPITFARLADMMLELNLANNDEIPNGRLLLSESTLKAALVGLDRVTWEIAHPWDVLDATKSGLVVQRAKESDAWHAREIEYAVLLEKWVSMRDGLTEGRLERIAKWQALMKSDGVETG